MIIAALLVALLVTIAVVVAAVVVRKPEPGIQKQERDIQDEVRKTVEALKDKEPHRSSTVGPPTIGGTRIFSAIDQPSIRFNCKTCGQHFDAPEGMAGEEITCPACSNTMNVPYTSEDSGTDKGDT